MYECNMLPLFCQDIFIKILRGKDKAFGFLEGISDEKQVFEKCFIAFQNSFLSFRGKNILMIIHCCGII